MKQVKLYILKTQGHDKIPPTVQIRDTNFSLIAYFREDRIDKGLKQIEMEHLREQFKQLLQSIPYGKIIPVTIKENSLTIDE